MKRFWWASAAYLLPTFPLGYAWHLVTFREQYERLGIFREEVIIPFGLLSMAVQALLFAWAYPRLFSTRREEWIGSAARFAGVFALLAWSFAVLPVSPLIALAWRGATHSATAAGSSADALRSLAG